MYCSDETIPMLLVCCFCDKVRDDTRSQTSQGLWRDLRTHMMSHKLRREETIISYTCCRDCLQCDPRAIAFRTRRSRPGVSVLDNVG